MIEKPQCLLSLGINFIPSVGGGDVSRRLQEQRTVTLDRWGVGGQGFSSGTTGAGGFYTLNAALCSNLVLSHIVLDAVI